jgi:hypothetical protein
MAGGVVFGLLLLFFIVHETPRCEADDKLVFTSILYRHGDRAPIEVFPTDPVPASFWYEGLQQLSQIGMRQHYHLGQFFYQRYAKELNSAFLFNNYTRTQIYVRSTDVDRTLMSAQCQLAGLFMPNDEQKFVSDLPWQPIPIHTVPTGEDSLLRGYDVDCPEYQKLHDDIPNTQEYKDVSKQYKDFFIFLAEKSGLSEVNMSNVWILSDTAYVQYVHNKPLSWVNDTVLEKLRILSGYDFKFMFDSTEKSLLSCGRLVRSMIDEMNMKENGSCPEEKIHFYSAHDTTVACLLSAFKSFNTTAPGYASAVLVELYKSTQSYYVKVWYKYGPLSNTTSGKLLCNESSPQPFASTEECLRPITIPGCSAFKCPYKEFVNAVKSVTVDNWNKECGLPTQPTCAPVQSMQEFCTIAIITTVVAGVLLLLLVFIVTVMCVVCVCKRRKKKSLRYSFLKSDDIQ